MARSRAVSSTMRSVLPEPASRCSLGHASREVPRIATGAPPQSGAIVPGFIRLPLMPRSRCIWRELRPWAGAVRDDCFGGSGQFEDELSVFLVKAGLVWPDADAGMDLGWPHVVVASAAVADADVQDAGPLPGQAGAERDSVGCGAGGRVRVAR